MMAYHTVRHAWIAPIVLLAAAFASAAEPTSKPEIPLFILAGQSNMNGAGVVAELPDELKQPANDVLYAHYWEVRFKPLDLSKATSFGPEVAFGREMAKALGRPVALAKLADGGTSLERNWNPSIEGKASLYNRLIEYAGSIKAKNPNFRVTGMIWMQGEADARYFSKTVDQYRDKFETLITGCRTKFGVEDMPFVAGRIDFHAAQYRKQVREAQQTVRCKRYAWIDCDDLDRHVDKLHMNTKGQLELGKRFAAAMIKLLNEPADKAPTTAPEKTP